LDRGGRSEIFTQHRLPHKFHYLSGHTQLLLESVFDGFPGIFRKSKRLADNGQHYYALQARYAQRKGGDTEDPDKLTFISALDAKKLELLIGFVTKMADDERASFRGWVANGISVVAVLVSATAVIWAATLKVAPLINGATAG